MSDKDLAPIEHETEHIEGWKLPVGARRHSALSWPAMKIIQPMFTEAEARAARHALDLALSMLIRDNLGASISLGMLQRLEPDLELISAAGKVARGLDSI